MMQDFYISLPSNTVGDSSRRENSSAHFRVQLSEEIHLPFDETWEVALVELQYPFSWFNITDDAVPANQGFQELNSQNQFDVLFVDKSFGPRLSIPPAHYKDIQAVTAAIYRLLKECDIEDLSRYVGFEWDESINRVVFNTAKDNEKVKGVVFSPHLQYLLGFGNLVVHAKEDRFIAKYPPDLRAGIDALYVYCDLVQPQLVGNRREKLLRIVPVKGKYGEIVGNTFTAPHYVPVLDKQFSTIEVSIKTDMNKPFAFQYGKTVVKLHFRKYRGLRL